MTYTDIQPKTVTEVLLNDGWHRVANDSFTFVHPSATASEPNWFKMMELGASNETTPLVGPLDSILAFRLKGGSPPS